MIIVLTVFLISLYQKGKMPDESETNNTVIEYTVEKGLTKDIYTVTAKIDSDSTEYFIEHITMSKSVESSFICKLQFACKLFYLF